MLTARSYQSITRYNANLSSGPSATNYRRKMHLKMLSAKHQPFYSDLSECVKILHFAVVILYIYSVNWILPSDFFLETIRHGIIYDFVMLTFLKVLFVFPGTISLTMSTEGGQNRSERNRMCRSQICQHEARDLFDNTTIVMNRS